MPSMKEEKQDWRSKLQDEVVLDQTEAETLATQACLAAGATEATARSLVDATCRRAFWSSDARVPALRGLP